MILSLSICGGLIARSRVMFMRVPGSTWETTMEAVTSLQMKQTERDVNGG